jgi:hypothetical protein
MLCVVSEPLGARLAVRSLISGVTTLLSLPLISFSFFLGYPSCFLIYIASGIVSAFL